MMALIHKGRLVEDAFTDISAGGELPAEGPVIVSLEQWQDQWERLVRRRTPLGIRLASDQHPEVIADLRKAFDAWWEKTVPLMVNEDVPYSPTQPQAVRYEKQKAERGIPDWDPPTL